MPLSAAQLAQLTSNQSAIDAATKTLAAADLATVESAQVALDVTISAQNAYIGTLVADTVPPVDHITVPSQSLPPATIGVPYSATLTATSSAGAIKTWQTIDSAGASIGYPVPAPGLSWGGVNPTTPSLVISGTPTTAEDIPFTFKITDAGGNTAVAGPYTLVIKTAPSTPPPVKGKVYVGGWVQNDVSSTEAFVTASGGSPSASVMMAFGYGADWGTVESSDVGQAQNLASWPGLKCLAVPMQTTGAPGTYTDVTSGSQDSVYSAIAKACPSETLIRLGWEYQNNPSGNMPAPVPAAQFVACFQHIVTVMRAANASLKFIWNPNDGTNGGDSPDYLSVFPGPKYVDICALDAYDNNSGLTAFESGATPNWDQIVALAKANGITGVALPEWSDIPSGASYSSGDQPSFADGVFASAEAAAAEGLDVYLILWGDGYPSTSGTWGAQCSPAFFAEVKKNVQAGIAAGVIAG